MSAAMIIAYKIGDLVQLKSGGPKMTITAIIDDHVRAAWFAGSKYEVAHVPMDALVRLADSQAQGSGD
jgi:uncharacterized protein YodC (DUF2158 family)